MSLLQASLGAGASCDLYANAVSVSFGLYGAHGSGKVAVAMMVAKLALQRRRRGGGGGTDGGGAAVSVMLEPARRRPP